LYHYLRDSKIKNYPIGFITITIASIVNIIYGSPLESAASGFQNFKPVINADFGSFFVTLFCAILLASIIFTQTNICTDLFRIKSNKRMLFLTGVTGAFGSISGFITGLAAPYPTKKAAGLKGKTKIVTMVEFLLLLFMTLFFAKIAPNIPSCTLGVILAIKSVRIIKKYFTLQKPKFLLIKGIYGICFILTVYNLTIGLLFCITLTLFLNSLHHKKYN